MSKFLEEAEQALQKFIPEAGSQKAKYSLERMTKFMDFLGNPQEKVKVIHIAGTSGKTSTCYYLSALLESAGLKVGLTVSPHIEKVSERVQINRQPIPDEEFAVKLDGFIDKAKQSGLELTYFELLMGFAYAYFAEAGVDVAIIETGLGGLLDGSNVVKNPDKTCVITDIGLDHTNVLGDKIEEIAAQKAGIIWPENQIYMFEQDSLINHVFAKRAQSVSATLNLLREQASDFDLPLFQRRNFNLAEQVVQSWLARNKLPPLSREQIKQGAFIIVPGRMEIIEYHAKTVILDGAHNTQKMQAMVDSFKAKYPNQKADVLLSVKFGKDYADVVKSLLTITNRLFITSFSLSQDMPLRSVEPQAIADACEQLGFKGYEIIPDYSQALTKLTSSDNGFCLVTGSLYLVSAVRSKLLAG